MSFASSLSLRCGLLGAALLLAFGAAAQPAATSSPPLSLAQAQALALEHNPTLRAARLGVDASDGGVLQSRARPNPELSYSQEDMRRSTRSSTLQWNQPIEIGGKREARMRVAERGRDLARAELAAAQAALQADVSTAFFGLLAAQQRVALSQQTLEIAANAREAAAKRVAAGKVAPLEETKARVAESGARLELSQAQSGLRVARQQLQALWGDSAQTMAGFGDAEGAVDALPPVPEAAVLQQRLELAPAVLRARQVLEQSRAAAELERAKRLPDPTVSLGVKRSQDGQDGGRNQVVFGVSVPLPVFDNNHGSQLQALRRADQAEEELQAVRTQLQAQLQEAREQLQTSRDQAEQLSSQVLPAAQSAYELSAKGFALGKFSYLEVLDAQRTWSDARSQYLNQLLSTHRAAASIDRLLGTGP
ncbi:MAG: TolC family protein [Comamonas sp.]